MSNRIGRYEIRSRLGSGAFATVYEAFDPRLESTVAIKLLADNWIHEPDVRARFRQEAVLLRRVQTEHPSAPLLHVYDIDESEEGRPYFVMRLADRGSLAERSRPGQQWSPEAILPVVDVLEDALGTLHQAGIVHRDVKPSNLLVTAAGSTSSTPGDTALITEGERLLLGDLGLAKDQLISGSALTVAGGTPRFMAPEQRDPAAPIDHRADLYAATVVVVDLLTGSPDAPDERSGLSDHALGVIATGMAVEPGNRFTDAASWAAAMRSLLTPGPVPEPVPQPVPEPAKPVAEVPNTIPPTPTTGGGSTQLGPRVAAGFIAATLLLAAVIFAFTRGGDNDITGPRETSVNEPITLSADVEDDERYVWTVGGRQVSDQDLLVNSDRAGYIDVELLVTSADGTTTESNARITVTE